METKNKAKKNDPVIHVSPKRYKVISRVAKLEGISRKAALESMLKDYSARA